MPALPGALLVAPSLNKKTGPCNATYVSQSTCPASCPFLGGGGCYGEEGRVGLVSRRLNAQRVTPREAILNEAQLISGHSIRALDGRLHVVGDCPDEESASLLAESCAQNSRKGAKWWGYTHNAGTIPYRAWGQISLWASVESPIAAREAMDAGYPAALVVPEFLSTTSYSLQAGSGLQVGLKGIPCPYQTRGVSCVECRLCLDHGEKLRGKGTLILFEAHGTGAKRARERLLSLPLIPSSGPAATPPSAGRPSASSPAPSTPGTTGPASPPPGRASRPSPPRANRRGGTTSAPARGTPRGASSASTPRGPAGKK